MKYGWQLAVVSPSVFFAIPRPVHIPECLAVPTLPFPQFPLPDTCIRSQLVFSSSSSSFLPSSRRQTSHSVWRISGMTLTPLVASIPEATQQALHKRSDSPTRHARPDVEETLRVSIGGSSHTRGFLHGWLSSASSPTVPVTIWMTFYQVGFSPHSTPAITHPNMLPRTISCHKSRVPCPGRLLPRPHLHKYTTSLSQGTTHRARKQGRHCEGVGIPSTNPT